MWYGAGNKVGTITPDGVITEFPLPTANTDAHYLAADPYGNMWVTERSANKVAKVQIPLRVDVTLGGDGEGGVTSDPRGYQLRDELQRRVLLGLHRAPVGASDRRVGVHRLDR